MDWDPIEGNWKQFKGKIKEKWGDLTDDDLDRIAGSRDQFEGLIQQRYGLSKDEARKQVNEWFSAQEMVYAKSTAVGADADRVRRREELRQKLFRGAAKRWARNP